MHSMVSEGLDVIPGSNLSLEMKFGKVCLISQKLNKFPSVLMLGISQTFDDPVLSCYVYQKLSRSFINTVYILSINHSCLVESGFYCPSLKNKTKQVFSRKPMLVICL